MTNSLRTHFIDLLAFSLWVMGLSFSTLLICKQMVFFAKPARNYKKETFDHQNLFAVPWSNLFTVVCPFYPPQWKKVKRIKYQIFMRLCFPISLEPRKNTKPDLAEKNKRPRKHPNEANFALRCWSSPWCWSPGWFASPSKSSSWALWRRREPDASWKLVENPWNSWPKRRQVRGGGGRFFMFFLGFLGRFSMVYLYQRKLLMVATRITVVPSQFRLSPCFQTCTFGFALLWSWFRFCMRGQWCVLLTEVRSARGIHSGNQSWATRHWAKTCPKNTSPWLFEPLNVVLGGRISTFLSNEVFSLKLLLRSMAVWFEVKVHVKNISKNQPTWNKSTNLEETDYGKDLLFG